MPPPPCVNGLVLFELAMKPAFDSDPTLSLVAKARAAFSTAPVTDRVFLGLDGCVDKIWSVVRVRHSDCEVEIMESMTEWAERIAAAAGSSGGLERILKRNAAGGFTANVGKALSTLCGRTGNIHLTGLFGTPLIQDILQEQLAGTYRCALHSIGNPGETDAFEFGDGKIMMVAMNGYNTLDWQDMMASVSCEFLVEQLDASKVWGLAYWSAFPRMSEIFARFQDTVFPCLANDTKGKYLVLDLSDMRKKSREAIQELVDILPGFEGTVKTVLSLNDRELQDLGSFLGGDTKDPLETTRLIQRKLNLSLVLGHAPDWATACSPDECLLVRNAGTSAPRYTTSAGDHFTAGVCHGLLAGHDTDILPVIGNCATSFFVRTGQSPTAGEIETFLAHYPEYLETRTPDLIG